MFCAMLLKILEITQTLIQTSRAMEEKDLLSTILGAPGRLFGGCAWRSKALLGA